MKPGMGLREWKLGMPGHFGLFLWCLVMVCISPTDNVIWSAALCLVVILAVYPGVWRNFFLGRRLLLMAMITLPPFFLIGEVDSSLLGVSYSREGFQAAYQIALRFLVVMGAVEGFTNAVDISTIAGMLERLGLKGLGFSMGVALNLLPSMKMSITQSWNTLKMRGGLRKKWWRGLRLFALTSLSNGLRRAEEIALAAEARAFSPEKARPAPIEKSPLDWLIIPLAAVSLGLVVFV